MDDQAIMRLFGNLLLDLDDFKFLLEKRPLLAHYTSISVLEQIMKEGEVWLSNPLYMNDLEEVRFGVQQGARLFETSDIDVACQSPERARLIRHAFYHYYSQFETEHAFDTYVFCLSEHEPTNVDGLLSMWRAYGASGNGAALVFNTRFISEANPHSPLAIARVHYASAEDRIGWMGDKIKQWCEIVRSSGIPDDKLYLAAYQLFNAIKFYALVSKHHGFREEREWRIIYFPERDIAGALKSNYGYVVGPRGVEPKLKLKIGPMPWTADAVWSFDILETIILGPTMSSPMARSGVNRMLEAIGRRDFQSKVFSSSIPLRPI